MVVHDSAVDQFTEFVTAHEALDGAAVWSSRDGIGWKRGAQGEGSEGATISGVTVIPISKFAPQSLGYPTTRIIAVGTDGSDAAVWQITPIWETCRLRLAETVRDQLGC